MGHDASIDIQGRPTPGNSPRKIIEALIEDGWSPHRDDSPTIHFIPLGDKEAFDWQACPASEWPKVLEILDAKTAASEIVAIVLVRKDALHGGTFLIDTKLTISFVPDGNRRELPGKYRPTDFSWYIARMVPALERSGYQIETIACSEHW